MILCKQARLSAAAAFCAAMLVYVIFDASNSNAAAAGLFGTPTAAEMRAAPTSAGTMRDALRGPSSAGVIRDRLVSLNLGKLARVVPVGADTAGDRLNRAQRLNNAVTL